MKKKWMNVFVPLFVFMVCMSLPAQAQKEEAADAVQEEKANTVFNEGDRIEIKVYREDDLSGVYEVDWAGSITFPLIGTIYVRDFQVDELRDHLIEKLSKYLIDPQVQIKRLPPREKTEQELLNVSILGQVNQQGSFQVNEGTTLMEIVSKAGGFSPSANKRKVRIVRKAGDGEKQIFFADGVGIINGKDTDPEMQDGDMVFVPESFF